MTYCLLVVAFSNYTRKAAVCAVNGLLRKETQTRKKNPLGVKTLLRKYKIIGENMRKHQCHNVWPLEVQQV